MMPMLSNVMQVDGHTAAVTNMSGMLFMMPLFSTVTQVNALPAQ